MTTQHSSYFRILTVWLVLIAFACSMIVPSLGHAKCELTSATAGDPGDGMDFSGGGGVLDGISDQDSVDSGGDYELPSIASLNWYDGTGKMWLNCPFIIILLDGGHFKIYENCLNRDWGEIQ